MAVDLQKMASYWELTQKAFDKIDDKKKLEWFTNLIDNLKGKETIKKLKDIWNIMTEEQKLKLYKKDAKDIGHFLLNRSPAYCIARTERNAIANTKKNWFKYASKYVLLEQVPCRFLVQLCILDKPETLSDTQLSKDTQKDAKFMNTYLWAAEAVCTVAPGAQEVVPFIWMARHYTKWYKNNCVPVMQDRIKNKQIKNTEAAIAETLSASERDVLKTEIIENKVA